MQDGNLKPEAQLCAQRQPQRLQKAAAGLRPSRAPLNYGATASLITFDVAVPGVALFDVKVPTKLEPLQRFNGRYQLTQAEAQMLLRQSDF